MSQRTTGQGKPSFWESKTAVWVACAAAALASVVMIFGNLSGIGIWEPWEANEVFLAREYHDRGEAPDVTEPMQKTWNWAVPTDNGKPVARPLLKTWLMSMQLDSPTLEAETGPAVGALESNLRFPLAAMVIVALLAGFAWLRRFFGMRAALIGTVAFATTPAVYIGTHNLASEMPWLAASTLTLLGFGGLFVDRDRRWLWVAVTTVGIGFSVADMRLMGLYMPLWIISAFALTELVMESAAGTENAVEPGVVEWGMAASLLAVVTATFAWAYVESADYQNALFLPHFEHLLGFVVPPLAALSGLLVARRTSIGRTFFSVQGLIPVAVGIVVASYIGWTVGEANPTLLKNGEIIGGIPSLEYLLTNHIFEKSLASGHLSLDIWLRQIGFSLLPWVALVPLALAYLTRAADLDQSAESLTSPQQRLRRYLVVWAAFAAIFVALAGAFGHIFYPAYFPLVAGVGVMFADDDFWEHARSRPLFTYAMGFLAAAIVLMLGKDLERFPVRFIEVYLTLQDGYELGDDFTFGRLFKVMKYTAMGIVVVYFFGLVSWAVITFKNVRALPSTWRAWRAGELEPDDEAPFLSRAREKEEVRQRDDIFGLAARIFERPQFGGVIITAVFAAFSAIILFHFVPNLTLHLSQRGVFEAYVASADEGEELYRYQVSIGQESVYLEDVPKISNYAELGELFQGDKRIYAVIPREKLASINYEVRRRFGKNLPVLDARSSRLLLVSNRLEAGETDKSFINDKIVEDPSEIMYSLKFANEQGEMVHPVFDDQLEMLGYSTDNEPGKDGIPAYGWGETMQITYYFRVLKRVPSSQKIFLHVDYPGNRINGDHYPNDGDFPTNYWFPGDIVKSVQNLEIESYSPPGLYSLHFGFFVGSRRMEIEPAKAHDGRNRMKIGEIRVKGL